MIRKCEMIPPRKRGASLKTLCREDVFRMRWIRWIARGVGLIASIYWSVPIIGGLISDNKEDFSLEGFILVVLIFLIILGFILAWFEKRIGGSIMVIGSIALCVFAYLTAGHNKALAVLSSGIPFLLSGVLFLIYFRFK